MKRRLTQAQVDAALDALPEWTLRARTIRRRYEFRGFTDAIEFVNRVAVRAEKANHHPNIDIRWNKVTLAFTTHDSGGLTGLDFSLARECDALFARVT